MAPISKWIAAAIFVVACFGLADEGALMGAARAQTPTTTLDTEMKYFYRAPSTEAVTKILKEFSHSPFVGNPASYPPLTGFLAAFFSRHPESIDAIVSTDVDPRVLWPTAIALRLAGQGERAEAVSAQMRAAGLTPPKLDEIPVSLEMVRAQTPSDFDVLWGASFATGDPHYCLTILDAFRSYANKDNNASELVAVEAELVKGSNADLRWVRQKWGDAKTIALVYMATALWGLRSNAAQHEFVKLAIVRYVVNHPDEPAARALMGKVVGNANGKPL